MMRLMAIGLCAVAGLTSFGSLVVLANDDAGALAFIRLQTRRRPAAVDPAPQRAYLVSFTAPRGFIPTFFQQPAVRRGQTAPSPRAQNARQSPIVASYAPFSGFFPTDSAFDAQPRKAVRITTPSVAKQSLALPFPSAGNGARGGRVAYCVRTCDGFFFPLPSSSRSDRADEAACNRLCPTAETKVYVGQIGGEIDDARSRQSGRRYAQMPGAFSYRRSVSQSCSCNEAGFGLTSVPVARDPTLKVGDIVMTAKGMRVFIGGQMPYREANFTTIDRSRRFAGESRESLRRMERASIPGRSGVTQTHTSRRPDELRDLRLAAETLKANGALVRYVGPDRTAEAR
jgi:hypothetical protein